MSVTTIILFQILLLIFFIVLSAFFSGSETALFSLNRARLLEYKASPHLTERLSADLMQKYNKTLVTLILGNMFVNIGISITQDDIFHHCNFTPVISSTLTVITAIFLLLIFGEITPKALAFANAEQISTKVSVIIWLLRKILSPVVFMVDKFFAIMLDMLGRKESEPLNHEEYSSYIEIAASVGAFTEQESETLEKVFSLRKKTVNRIMTGRVDIHTVRKEMTVAQIMELIKKTQQKFYPVIKDDIDDTEGLLSTKDFFMLSFEERKQWQSSSAVKPFIFIPENTGLTKALSKLRENFVSVALVSDEYGGIAGLIEMEDVYEELVGDIDDEHEPSEWQIKRVGENEWLLNGFLALDELSDAFELEVSDYLTFTLSGVFSEILGRIPEVGDTIALGNLTLSVLKMDKHRVLEVKAERQKEVK